MPAEIIEVVAYSGYRGEECPKLFMVQGKKIEVLSVVARWIEECLEDKTRKRFFHVRGSDGYEYKLYYDEEIKQWFLAEK